MENAEHSDHHSEHHEGMHDRGAMASHYKRFGLMILTSSLIMFGVMYLNTYAIDHVFFSETRLYMTLLMAATMAIIMLSFMLHMHRNRKWNLAIYAGSVILFAAALFLVRSQTLVDDTSYMEGMIPHHSIAILTSERAGIEDQRVRELADGIIRAQRKEIKEMKWLIEDIGENGIAATPEEAASRPVPDFEGNE